MPRSGKPQAGPRSSAVSEVNRYSGHVGGASLAPQRNWKRFSLRIVGSMLVLALLFFFLPRDQLFAALSQFSAGIWLAGVSVYLCLHLIGVAKWRMLLNAAGAGMGFAHAARCYYYGLFGNTFLPSVIGGDIVRAGLAMKICPARGAVLMGSIADRAVDSAGLALVAGTGAFFLPMALDENSTSIFWGFAILVFAACAAMGALFLALPARRFPFRVRRQLVKARLAVRSLVKHPARFLLALVYALLLQTAQVVMNLWLGRLALIQNATLLMWLFVWPLAKLAATLPLTQGGVGVREAAQGMLFLPLGISIEKAVATGLIFQAIVIGGNLLAGGLAAIIGRFVPPGAIPAENRTPALKSPPEHGLTGALFTGGFVFFVANTLAIAYGTGSVGAVWVDWMTLVPGLGASFIGSLAGFLYGAAAGYLLGRTLGKLAGD